MAKKGFVVEVTFNNKIIFLRIDIMHDFFENRPDFN